MADKERKPTGVCDGNGKMMHVGDKVWYDDGFCCFHDRIVEHEGKFGVFLDGKHFYSIQDLNIMPDELPDGADFTIEE